MSAAPAMAASTTLSRIRALLNWRDDLTKTGYDVMSPQELLGEIKNYMIFARSSNLPECLVQLRKQAEDKLKKNEKRGQVGEVFAAAGVFWIIDNEVNQLLDLTS
jgi:hypothetical protein